MNTIVHLHTFSDSTYIRMLSLNDINSYFEELKVVYHHETPSKEEYCVFYNVYDIYHRLSNDIKYKNFKGFGKLIEDAPGLLKFSSSAITKTWFKDVFLPFIKDKMSAYVADIDDEMFLDMTNIDLTAMNEHLKTHIDVKYNAKSEQIQYILVHCPKDDDNMYVPSKDHLQALFIEYCRKNTLKFIEPIVYNRDDGTCKDGTCKETHENTTDVSLKTSLASDLITELITNTQGIKINKNVLDNCDVELLVDTLQLRDEFEKAARSTIGKIDAIIHDQIAGYTACESEYYTSSYSFIKKAEDPMHTLWDKLYLIGETNPQQSTTSIVMYTGDQDLKVQNTKRKFYKNAINDIVVCMDNHIQYLKEFNQLFEIAFKTNEVSTVVDQVINGKIVNEDIIEDLSQLLTHFKSFIDKKVDDSCTDVDNEVLVDNVKDQSMNRVQHLQFTAIKDYVNLHKNDVLETLASTVIDNVFDYLTKICQLPESIINRNQIGKDLVELGVKKNRKSKGFVYGIEDTSKPSQYHESPNSVYTRQAKTIRNFDLRAELKIPKSQVSPWCYSTYE